jgi:hypothetical protein
LSLIECEELFSSEIKSNSWSSYSLNLPFVRTLFCSALRRDEFRRGIFTPENNLAQPDYVFWASPTQPSPLITLTLGFLYKYGPLTCTWLFFTYPPSRHQPTPLFLHAISPPCSMALGSRTAPWASPPSTPADPWSTGCQPREPAAEDPLCSLIFLGCQAQPWRHTPSMLVQVVSSLAAPP